MPQTIVICNFYILYIYTILYFIALFDFVCIYSSLALATSSLEDGTNKVHVSFVATHAFLVTYFGACVQLTEQAPRILDFATVHIIVSDSDYQ